MNSIEQMPAAEVRDAVRVMLEAVKDIQLGDKPGYSAGTKVDKVPGNTKYLSVPP